MNWSRVKTVLIILFLCTDIFLLATYLTSKYASSTISPDVIESTVEVLENNNIKVDSAIIPQKIPSALSLDADNVISDYEAFARKVLGSELSAIDFGYESMAGKVTFFGDRFNFVRNTSLDVLTDLMPVTDEKMAKDVTISSLQQLGFDLENAEISTEKTDAGYTVTLENQAGSLPIFNSQVVVTLSKSGITSVSGIWFNEAPSQGGNINIKSITSALIDFIPSVIAPAEITEIQFGYNIFDKASYHKSSTLIPVWKVTLKDGSTHLLDARNM
ncbi:MAG: two-component system regulatory protein YycI [Clostridia bacterium]|nr:two-component system regulatory protein YycI [Clostridia bacterium]